MIKVDVVFPYSLGSGIGPVGTIRRILASRDYFLGEGLDITVFAKETPQGTTESPKAEQLTEWKNARKHKGIKEFVKDKAKNSALLSKMLIKRSFKFYDGFVHSYLALDRNADVVVFHSGRECFTYLRSTNKTIPTAVFYHTDGIPLKMDEIYYPRLHGSYFFRQLYDNEEYVARNVGRICFIAKIGRENFLEYYPFVKKEQTALIVNGIDDLTSEQRQYIDEKRKEQHKFKYRICTTGTVNIRKGQRMIVEAIHKLPGEIQKNFSLTIVGNGVDLENIKDLSEKYGLTEQINLPGQVVNTDVYKYLADANLYCLMSNNEGLPISILEAERAGLPVISTNVSGIPETIDEGSNGFLINPNADELASVLSKLDDYDLAAMGKCSRNKFENEFTFERMKRDYCKMIKNLAK